MFKVARIRARYRAMCREFDKAYEENGVSYAHEGEDILGRFADDVAEIIGYKVMK